MCQARPPSAMWSYSSGGRWSWVPPARWVPSLKLMRSQSAMAMVLILIVALDRLGSRTAKGLCAHLNYSVECMSVCACTYEISAILLFFKGPAGLTKWYATRKRGQVAAVACDAKWNIRIFHSCYKWRCKSTFRDIVVWWQTIDSDHCIGTAGMCCLWQSTF